MVTTNLQDVLFKVDLHPVYTVLKKKPELFAGYAVINLDENKILKTVSTRYELRTNAELIERAIQLCGNLTFDFAHLDNKKSYFYIYFLYPSQLTGQWQWAVEIINAYDCKTAPKINVCFKHIVHKYYAFTNVSLETSIIPRPHEYVIGTFGEEKGDVSYRRWAQPFPAYIYHIQKPQTTADIDILAGIELWRQKSHQQARNWLADEIDYLLNEKDKI